MTWTVTLERLRSAGACFGGYNKLVRSLQGKPFTEADEGRETYIRFSHKEEVSLECILDSNGLDDALWATRCITGHDRDLRLFAVWCARQVEHLMTDTRSIRAVEVAERYANGEASESEIIEANNAAWGAQSFTPQGHWYAPHRAAWRTTSLNASMSAYLSSHVVEGFVGSKAQEDMLRQMLAGTAPWQS